MMKNRNWMNAQKVNYCILQRKMFATSTCLVNRKNLRTAWNYESNNRILNISDLLPVTFYVEDRTANRLTLKYYTYSATGQLDIYIKTYKTVETIIEDGKLRLKESHQ